MKYVLSICLLFQIGCSYLTSVSQTSIPAKKGKQISAKASKNIFFMLSFSNKFADQVRESLVEQCPNGSVKGILTKQEHTIFVPILLHQISIKATGYCHE